MGAPRRQPATLTLLAALPVPGVPGAFPEDVLHRLFGQLAWAAAVVRLPVPGKVADNHVPNQHRLKGLLRALSR